jgi:hypothetical protein
MSIVMFSFFFYFIFFRVFCCTMPRKKAAVAAAKPSAGKKKGSTVRKKKVFESASVSVVLGGVSAPVVTPEKGSKFFYSINMKSKSHIKHKSKEAAMQWMADMKNLDFDAAQNYMVQDFSSDESMQAFLDSMDFMQAARPSANPMALSRSFASGMYIGHFSLSLFHRFVFSTWSLVVCM